MYFEIEFYNPKDKLKMDWVNLELFKLPSTLEYSPGDDALAFFHKL